MIPFDTFIINPHFVQKTPRELLENFYNVLNFDTFGIKKYQSIIILDIMIFDDSFYIASIIPYLMV